MLRGSLAISLTFGYLLKMDVYFRKMGVHGTPEHLPGIVTKTMGEPASRKSPERKGIQVPGQI